jgi:hypothetical protein
VNPRIKELARESGLLVYNPNGVPTKLEKFAELIVKECMRMCEVAQVGYLTHGLEKEASGAISVKQYIEEYLGVE